MSRSYTRRQDIHITRDAADGVIRTQVHIKNLAIAGMGAGVQDCFRPDLVCDTGEIALIEELRAYLRPNEAPPWLLARLKDMLDSYCNDE